MTKPAIRVFAPAKVNLCLHVTGQRDDGYHLLDSIVVFPRVGDVVELTPGPVLRLTVDGPFASGVPTDARNLVWQVAQAAGWRGHIHLSKHLPHGAGIGGGSSDAGAVLRALDAGLDPMRFGADVPVCQLAKPARMAGIGEQITQIKAPPSGAMVLVNPGHHVPTPGIFKALSRKDNPALPPLPQDQTDWLPWLFEQRNDLQPAACAIAPVIQTVLDALSAQPQARLVRMSGSGATCFALCDSLSDANAIADDIQSTHPAWWCIAAEY